MEIVDTLFRSIFFGFIVWTVFWVLTKRKQVIGHRTEDIDAFIIWTTILFGGIHIAFLIPNSIEWDSGIKFNESMQERAFGEYWFGFWMYPVTYFGLTQLLWIYRVRKSKPIRILIALWIFVVMHFEKFVIFTTTLMHRDFSSDGNIQFPTYILQQVGLSWLIGMAVFTVVVIIGMKVKNAVQHKV